MFTIKIQAVTETEQNIRQLVSKLDCQIEEAEGVLHNTTVTPGLP